MHDGYVRHSNNTNSYEQIIHEEQADGSIIIKKHIITNGIIENDKQMAEIARQLGEDFTYKSGVHLGDPLSDED